MTAHMTRRTLLAALTASLAVPTDAAERAYGLVAETSRITFTFFTNGGPQSGTVPVTTAEIFVDTARLGNSRAVVTADIRRISSGLIFVTEAIKSKDLLDAATHPFVRFASTAIHLGRKGRISEGAKIDGQLTLRGVTLPVSFVATLARPEGSAPDDLSVLYVRLTGSIDRQAFGADGYKGLAENRVDLDIFAEIRALD